MLHPKSLYSSTLEGWVPAGGLMDALHDPKKVLSGVLLIQAVM